MDRIFLGFLFVWFVSAFIRLFFVEGVSDAIIDVRSIGMMFLTSFVLIWSKAYIGFVEWRTTLTMALKNVFFLLTVFSLFELMTGIHFTGAFTEKISHLPISGYTYSPVFLFDNPNNLVTYFLLIGSLILLLDVKSLRKPFMTFFIVLVCFMISHVSMSRIGEATSIFLFAYYLVMYVPGLLKKIKKDDSTKRKVILGLTVTLLMIIVYVKNDKYYGPIWKDKGSDAIEISSENHFANNIDNQEKKEVITNKYGVLKYESVQLLDKDSLDELFGSTEIRKGLFFNGVEFFKESKLFGIGPGQYRYLHKTGQVENYTRTNISAHFWFIELISQFGLFIFVPYLLLLLWISYVAIRKIKKNVFTGGLILSCILVFGLSSLLPSSFLILDINWIFIAILVGFVSNLNLPSKQSQLDE